MSLSGPLVDEQGDGYEAYWDIMQDTLGHGRHPPIEVLGDVVELGRLRVHLLHLVEQLLLM